MNVIWTATTVAALIALCFSGGDALSVCIEGCTSAVTVCFGLCAVYCLWLGVFRVAEQCGVIDSLSRLLRPVIKALFGCVSPQAEKSIALNLASNVVGAGNAATPSAVQALAHTEKGEKLSRAGAMLFVLNACGVQMVPSTVIGLRASAGSAGAADILPVTIICTLVCAVVGAALTSLFFRK